MNNVDKLYPAAGSLGEFARGYFGYLKSVLDSIDPQAIDRLGAELEDARERDATVFVAGNGGSAATATTMANDLGFDIVKKTGTERPFRLFALTDNTAVLTAIANDVGYESVFVGQLQLHYRPGDALIVISASGNSPNVVRAAEWVHEAGGRVIGLLGFDGGKLKGICDCVVHVKTLPGEYGPVEDAHLILNHVLSHWFQNRLSGG